MSQLANLHICSSTSCPHLGNANTSVNKKVGKWENLAPELRRDFPKKLPTDKSLSSNLVRMIVLCAALFYHRGLALPATPVYPLTSSMFSGQTRLSIRPR